MAKSMEERMKVIEKRMKVIERTHWKVLNQAVKTTSMLIVALQEERK